MNPRSRIPHRRVSIGLLLATAAAAAAGAERPAGTSGPVPAARPEAPSAEETVSLSPFEVVADAGDTYDAANTNAVTGTNLALIKTPLSAKIFNRTLMDELGVNDVGMMLVDFGGLGSPLLGAGSDAQRGMQEGDGVDYKTMTSRGHTISNPRRDGLLRSDTSLMDSFDVESAEAVQGSNSFLFGSGDAGGVININSKRARLNQRSLVFAAKWDSESSSRYTVDANVGTGKFAVRINGLKSDTRYYRPLLGLDQEGLQVSATIRPFRWITVSGEYRHYIRDHIRAGNATVRTPTSFRLGNGETMDNKSVRYITGLGGSDVLGNYITLRNQDSVSGAFLRHYYTVASYSAAVELSPGKDLHFQLRYGEDKRTNGNPAPTNEVLYHPDAPGNLAPRNADGTRPWALNFSPGATARTESAEGYKITGLYRRDLGRWGDHRLNGFVSAQDTRSIGTQFRFVETDVNGNIIFQGPLLSALSGQIAMPDAWTPAFPTSVWGNDWPAKTIVHPTNGKTYRWTQTVYPGSVAVRPGNPLGTSGAIPASGGRPSGYSSEMTREKSQAVSLNSEFWGGRINTMAGFRFETAETSDLAAGGTVGPVDYDTSTLGVVFDTPIRGLRGYASRATNARVSFGTARDIYDGELPIGQGVTREAGLKFAMFDHRISGNIAYYVSEGRNFTGTIPIRDDVDPAGINGRNGGNGFAYDKRSEGIDLGLSLRPKKWWEVRVNYSEGDGRERSNVTLPIFYNDEFNTTTLNGQSVVAVKNATTGALSPFMVPSVRGDAASPQAALSVAMLRDPGSSYFATLDPESGFITNASTLLLTTPGVGTGRTGLDISTHQLGFRPPSPEIIVRRAGERTTGYAERSFSLINRFQVSEGRFRGTVFGLTTVIRDGLRGYMLTDAARGGERRLFYYPDQVQQGVFALYRFRPFRKIRATLQLNVDNVFDKQAVVALPNSTTGAVRYFAYQYSPRKFSVTTRLSF